MRKKRRAGVRGGRADECEVFVFISGACVAHWFQPYCYILQLKLIHFILLSPIVKFSNYMMRNLSVFGHKRSEFCSRKKAMTFGVTTYDEVPFVLQSIR